MQMDKEYIENLSHPFILFLIGIEMYEGEYNYWDLPNDQVTDWHILARIQQEIEWLKIRTGEDFYLFGTKQQWKSPRIRVQKEIGTPDLDILFTVNVGRERNVRIPSTASLLPIGQERQESWHTMVSFENIGNRQL